ncbi:hypothetical protein YQE_07711, partial [Dendroctonus ponderosae]
MSSKAFSTKILPTDWVATAPSPLWTLQGTNSSRVSTGTC